MYFFFFKQKTAYEMRISDWSSDVCSSDLIVSAAMDITGSSSVITGGASGLGEATARLLAEKGQHVVIVDMNEEKGEAVAKEIGGVFVKADVANAEQVIAAVEAAKEMGPLKTLLTAAGLGAAQRTIGKGIGRASWGERVCQAV